MIFDDISRICNPILLYMFTIQDAPIHCMGDRCVYPSKKLMNKKSTQCSYEKNRQELYGNTEQQFSRFNELGVPMFVVKINDSSNDSYNDSLIHTQGNSSVISNELFDQLFERVSKHKKVKKNNKNKSGNTKSNKPNTTRKSKPK